ncbi:hypothetical protein [Bacillus sp. CHD6a]|uniref:hypothetical protein n=1 Tax=Bacillus sp. CHD6a TaxID=1643452 RepID=UPI0006CDFA06|nr:hypothetical protein [Bacillus sp. CHD6a]KPB06264.1 hypothetical protein AAV98_00175 [Bacillus sp. CHD6a]
MKKVKTSIAIIIGFLAIFFIVSLLDGNYRSSSDLKSKIEVSRERLQDHQPLFRPINTSYNLVLSKPSKENKELLLNTTEYVDTIIQTHILLTVDESILEEKYKLKDIKKNGLANKKLLKLNFEDPLDRSNASAWLGIVLNFQESIFTINEDPEQFLDSYIEATREVDAILNNSDEN